jgi:hypothetical protein
MACAFKTRGSEMLPAEVADSAWLVVSTIIVFRAPHVDIFSSAKQRSKQGDSLSGTLLLIHWCAVSTGLVGGGLAQFAEPQCREPPEAAGGEHSPRESEYFLLWRLEWKTVRTVPGHVARTASVMTEPGLRYAASR